MEGFRDEIGGTVVMDRWREGGCLDGLQNGDEVLV